MTRRNKKRRSSNHKKFFNRPHQNQQDDTENNETKAMSVYVPQAKKKCYKNRTGNLQRKPCLSIVEQAANVLKGPNCTNLISILDVLFSIYNKEPTKRPLQLEVLNMLLLNIMDRDTDFDALKTKLNSVFWPKDLKQIMVGPSELTETVAWGSFFGFVFGIQSDQGYLTKGRRIKVHIKKAEDDEDNVSIIQEAKLLSQLSHENIIKILAFDKSGPRMAVEYMSLDNLCSALEDFHFSGTKLINILKDVAAGMSYLAEKKYVLRNLSSENILLDSSGSCKISNLKYCQYVGDSGGIYIDEGSDVDIDFAAPEVRNEHKYSTKSDVWDMGLLGWEVFMNEPNEFSFMPGILKKLCLLRIFISSNVLPKPSKCPLALWLFIEHRLLGRDPAMRPTFAEVMNQLTKFDSWRFSPGFF